MGLKVNQCCCGCSLQTGTKVIGWFYLVLEIVDLVMNVFTIISIQTAFSEIGNPGIYPIFEIVGIVISAITIAVTVPLLIATYKISRPMLLLPWLIFAIISTISAIGLGIYESSVEETFGAEKIASISSKFVGSAFTIYFWLVVYSYYQHLKEI